jgi:hypothetical protein
MKSFFSCFKWIIVVLIFLFFIGCATTPNKPYTGPLPGSLSKLDQLNPKLGEELKKLPEIRDGISQNEIKALEAMADLYHQMPEKFDSTFNQMYQVGKPEVRKYCSPLQALFWLFEDGKIDDAERIIENYSLDALLDKAWDFKIPESFFMPYETVNEVIKGIKDLDLVKEYKRLVKDRSSRGMIQRGLIMDLRRNKKNFSRDVRKIIKEYKNKKYVDSRWENFDTVVDRLNSTFLIHDYISKNIEYKTIPGITYSPKTVFKRGWGDSDDLAYFGKSILDRAGYKTFWVEAGDRDIIYHPGSGITQDDGSYLLVVDFGTTGNDYGFCSNSRNLIKERLALKLH